MSANLNRLSDLTTELRRQLKPLGRQAEMARRAQTIQADLRDARLRLAADDLVIRRSEFNDTNQAETTLRREHDETSTRLETATIELTTHETAVSGLSGRAEAAQQTWFRLSALAERVSATVRIASDRAQLLDAEAEVSQGADPDELDAQADEVAVQEQLLLDELAQCRDRQERARAELSERERLAAEAERAHLAAARAEADRREGLARLSGQVDTMRTRVESIDEGVARLTVSLEESALRVQQSRVDFETVQNRVGDLDAGEVGLDDQHDRTVSALRLADERVSELQAAERAAERQVASLRARIDALAVGLDRRDGAAWLQKNHDGAGLFGAVAKMLRVRAGHEAAVAAVLGPAADALAAESFGAARSAVAALKESDGGRAAIVLGDWPEAVVPQRDSGDGLPDGALWAVDLVEPAPRLRGAVKAMLAGVVVVSDLTAALDLVASHPRLRAVTSDGDLVGAGWLTGGSDRKPSTLEITSEIDKARTELESSERQVSELTAALSGALAEQASRQDAAEDALAALNESDAAISAIYEQLGRLGLEAAPPRTNGSASTASATSSRRAARRRSRRCRPSRSGCATRRRRPRSTPLPVDRQESVAAAEEARAAEFEARLAVRTAEERANAVRGRADSLRRAAAAEREARLRAQRARVAREHAAAVAAAVAESGRLVAASAGHRGRRGGTYQGRPGRRAQPPRRGA